MYIGLELTHGTYGVHATIQSAWNSRMLAYMKSRNVVELELNSAKGWSGNDLEFLCHLPELQMFEILDLGFRNVDPIHFLHELRRLEVSTYCRTEIRFPEFPMLEVCTLEWRPKAKSLFECVTLKDLFVNRYHGTDSSPFGNLTELNRLGILNSPLRDLHGFEPLRKLQHLRLNRMSRLASLSGIDKLVNLEHLDISGCRKIRSIEELRRCARLKRLFLNQNNEIESLRPLEELQSLEAVSFVGTTKIIDGDLAPLKGLANLKGIVFMNRRHYSHKCEDFGWAYYNCGSVCI
jgi:hypothetical protein